MTGRCAYIRADTRSTATREVEPSSDPLADGEGELLGGQRGIQHEEALRLGGSERKIRRTHPLVELGLLGLEPVEGLVVGVEPGAGGGGIEVEQNRNVRQRA